MTKNQRQRAIQLIGAVLSTAKKGQIQSMLCAVFGHPPVVHACFGELTCARCGAHVGDTMLGASTLKGRVLFDHDCPECREVWKKMTPEQKLLTPTKSPKPRPQGHSKRR